MSTSVFYKSYPEPALDVKEVLRFAACKEENADILALIESCEDQMRSLLSCRVCYSYFPVYMDGEELDLGFARVKSAALAKNLVGCTHIVLFAATVGVGADRLIARYSRTQPSRSHIMQALGAQRVEALCDVFCGEVAEEAGKLGFGARPRFSPGYGDLSLEIQKDIFRALDVTRGIGVNLNESLIMFPTKSVTALIGLYKI